MVEISSPYLCRRKWTNSDLRVYNKVRNEEENVFVDGTHDGVDGNECPEFWKQLCWEGHWEFHQDHDHWWNHPLKVWVPDRRGGGTIRGACFIDSSDIKYLTTRQEDIAKYISNGIVKYLGVEKNPSSNKKLITVEKGIDTIEIKLQP